MSDELQQAITLIKSGDKQNGRRLLAEILKAEPRNEQAWLWMSSVVILLQVETFAFKAELL